MWTFAQTKAIEAVFCELLRASRVTLDSGGYLQLACVTLSCVSHDAVGGLELSRASHGLRVGVQGSVLLVLSNSSKSQELCQWRSNISMSLATQAKCDQQLSQKVKETNSLWMLMATAQLLAGVGSVPIQPFGISYVDDFADPRNSALYIAILFAVSVFGPSIGYLMGSGMLRIYVDVGRMIPGLPVLTPRDPRWIGAWWMGLLISSGFLAISSLPYFFFPRTISKDTDTLPGDNENAILKDTLNRDESSFFSFIRSAFNLPAAAIGMLLGGIIMKRMALSLKIIPRFSVVVLLISVLLCLPLFFMGCPTQRIAGIYPSQDQNKYPIDRMVASEEKSFAIGVQFLLMRVLAQKYTQVTGMEEQKYFWAEEKNKFSSDPEVLLNHMRRRTGALPGQRLFEGLVKTQQAELELGGRVMELLGEED
ncbi:SO2A1 protein, partial [Polypterus senegalus]